MSRWKPCLGSLLMMLGLSLTVAGTLVQAQSGSLEPPGSAVNGSGDPRATTQTQPSWDQVLPANERFKLVMGGEAVLDKETGLVWEQSPAFVSGVEWNSARVQCVLLRNTGGRLGWRLPSVHELASLVDATIGSGIHLPPGHPFSNITDSQYWSRTEPSVGSSFAWTVSFINGGAETREKISRFPRFWCVRGGQNHGDTN